MYPTDDDLLEASQAFLQTGLAACISWEPEVSSRPDDRVDEGDKTPELQDLLAKSIKAWRNHPTRLENFLRHMRATMPRNIIAIGLGNLEILDEPEWWESNDGSDYVDDKEDAVPDSPSYPLRISAQLDPTTGMYNQAWTSRREVDEQAGPIEYEIPQYSGSVRLASIPLGLSQLKPVAPPQLQDGDFLAGWPGKNPDEVLGADEEAHEPSNRRKERAFEKHALLILCLEELRKIHRGDEDDGNHVVSRCYAQDKSYDLHTKTLLEKHGVTVVDRPYAYLAADRHSFVVSDLFQQSAALLGLTRPVAMFVPDEGLLGWDRRYEMTPRQPFACSSPWASRVCEDEYTKVDLGIAREVPWNRRFAWDWMGDRYLRLFVRRDMLEG